MSAQEAAYHCLSLPLSRSSRAFVYINTNLPDDRVKMLKSKNDLKKLSPDSNEIFLNDIFDKYSNRSRKLREICLAEFAASYHKQYPKQDEVNDDEDPNDKYKERLKPKIIRYRRFKFIQDPYNYYREQLILFLPWFDESEINGCNVQKKYVKFQSKIETNRKKFAVIGDERFDDAVKEMDLDFDNSSDSDDPLENHLPQEHYVDVLSQFSPQLEPIKNSYLA